MGLAPYGEAKYADLIKEKIINVSDDGSFQLDMSYFNYASGLTMTNKSLILCLEVHLGILKVKFPERDGHAASIQKVTEEIIIKIAKAIFKDTGEKNLCLAGGVALNCVANGILLREKIFDNIWIQPAAGDSGGALGAALSAWYIHYGKKRIISSNRDSMKGAFLGPEFSNKEIEAALLKSRANFHKYNEKELLKKVAILLSEGKAIGWMQGRMEFGPRALGARSILADPRSSSMQKQLNLKVKFRESFRPFAPSILRNHLNDWFELDCDSPYMLLVEKLKKSKCRTMSKNESKLFGIEKLNVKRSEVTSITHLDYSARIQTVHRDTNARYNDLILTFYKITGCPILVNTSFNVRGEPIVCTPSDAFKCFMGNELDALVIGDFLLLKRNKTLI